MDQLPRLGKRELIRLLLFTCNYVVSVWRGFLFLWVLGMGYVILLWHSLSLPYNYFTVKYKRSLLFYEARKIIEEQLTAPGKRYASIIKGAGFRCTDAQTQTGVAYDIQLTSPDSGGGPTPNSGQNAGGGLPPAP